MIVSVSRRTDIVALYTNWFIEKLKQGYCEVVNPYNRNQISKVSLKPQDVDFFVFWTRHPQPIIPYLKFINEKGYKYYFLITLNNYPSIYEKHIPDAEKVIKSIQNLSLKIGKEKVIWRYDPIIISDITPESWHLKNFNKILFSIHKSISKIIISFVDVYQKNKKFIKMLQDYHSLKLIPSTDFIKQLSKIAKDYNLKIQTCSENIDLSAYDIEHGACIDSKILGLNLKYKKDPYQRKECLCEQSKDIGRYDTCVFGCEYCYASNYNRAIKFYKKYINSQKEWS